jgi:ribosomal subunit interface protein
MRLTIKATGIEHTNALDAYVTKKLVELEKYLDPKEKSCIARIEIGKETKHHKTGQHIYKAELTMRAGKRDFRIVKTDDSDLYAAIDAMKAEAVSDVKDYFSRLRVLKKEGDRKAKKILKSL